MAFQPSKQQLDNDIPAACKAINAILVQLQKATGADDQFIARIRGARAAMAAEHQPGRFRLPLINQARRWSRHRNGRCWVMGTDFAAILISSVFIGAGFVIARFFQASLMAAVFLVGLAILNITLAIVT